MFLNYNCYVTKNIIKWKKYLKSESSSGIVIIQNSELNWDYTFYFMKLLYVIIILCNF